jgi:hypothetical protein
MHREANMKKFILMVVFLLTVVLGSGSKKQAPLEPYINDYNADVDAQKMIIKQPF